MKHDETRGGAVLAALFLALALTSGPVPVLDVDKLTADASVIVVGRITSIQQVGHSTVPSTDASLSAKAMVAKLQVDQVLKNIPDVAVPLLTIIIPLSDDSPGLGRVEPMDSRIFFLAESSDGLTPVSPYYPSLVAVSGREPREGSAIERVVDQLEFVLISSTTPLERKQEAVFALSRTKAVAATRALRENAEQKDFTLRLSIAAALLERNDISALPFAEAVLLDQHPGAPPYLLHNLTYAISQGVRNEEAISSLARLLHAPATETRRASALALMHTGSEASIVPLLSGLRDSDLQVRYYSAVGLAEITGQTDWRPNMNDFVSGEERYLKHWKDWANNR